MPTPTVNPSLHALLLDTELATALNLTYANLSNDQADHLRRVINGVSAGIRNYLNTNVIRQQVTEYHDGDGRSIFVGNTPIYLGDEVNYPFTVHEDGTALARAADGSDEKAGGGTPDCFLIPEIGQLERHGRYWKSGRRIIKVIYTAGRAWQYVSGSTVRTSADQALGSISYDAGTEDIWQAAIILCKWAADIGSQTFGTQFTEAGTFIRNTAAWPRAALDYLEPYRRAVVTL